MCRRFGKSSKLLLLLLLICISGCRLWARVPPVGGPEADGKELFPLAPLVPAPPVGELPDIPPPRIDPAPETSEVWALPIREAVGIALRNSDILRTLDGDSVAAAPVTSYDPAIQEAQLRAAVAAFDPVFSTGYVGSRYNQPPGTFLGPGINVSTRRDEGALTASVSKPWQTGATTTVGMLPASYLFLPNGSTNINPRYQSDLEFSLKQPLLRGFGVQVNTAPIRVAQLQADQSIWDVKQGALGLVRSVEEAYWELQAAHVRIRALDDVLPLVDNVVHVQQERMDAERAIEADVAKAMAQQAFFRQQRVQARAIAMQKELQLRNLLGLDPADGRVIVPVDAPMKAPLYVDPPSTVALALDNRPDLMRQRLNVRIRELQLLVTRNGLKPQLDATAFYRLNGLGQDVGDMLEQIRDSQYTDWTLGITYSRAIGNRVPRANYQAAEIQLHKESALFRQKVHAAAFNLSDILRRLTSARDQYELALRRVEKTNIWLKGSRIRYEDPPPDEGDDWLLSALNDYLLALRAQTDAATELGVLLAEYNVLLARLEEAKGTLLDTFQIQLLNDPARQMSTSPWPYSAWNAIEPASWMMDGETARVQHAVADDRPQSFGTRAVEATRTSSTSADSSNPAPVSIP